VSRARPVRVALAGASLALAVAAGLQAAPALAAASGTWTATGSLSTTGLYDTATLLPDGQVLVAGGLTATAELYNPATGTFTATGSMTNAQPRGTATLLPDGQVLVAGGETTVIGPALASAELYNPATGKWTATGTMNATRVGHTATLLGNGEVLVVGGIDDTGGVISELYNPATGTWSASSSGLVGCEAGFWCRYNSTAVLLSSGEVLVAGGLSGNISTYGSGSTSSAMLYNPATNAWTSTGNMTTPREGQTATLLPDGQVLVTGGYNYNHKKAALLASAELYTP
jgi:large repetitive protein